MNYFNELEHRIFKNTLDELKLSKKNKKFWDYLFTNHLVPEYIIVSNAHLGNNPEINVLLNQVKLAEKYGETISERVIKDMLRRHIDQDIFPDILTEFIKIGNKKYLSYIIQKNSSQISFQEGNKLLKIFDINELYELGVSDEELLSTMKDYLDKELFLKLGFRENLSTKFINSIRCEMESVNMADTPIDKRPNIGINKSPLYQNAGCCIENTHTNGVSIYIPYGIYTDLFNSINTSIHSIRDSIDSLRKTILNLDNTDGKYNSLKESLTYQLYILEKQELLLSDFSGLQHEV